MQRVAHSPSAPRRTEVRSPARLNGGPRSRLPLFVDLQRKKVLVVGGGNVAASKLPSLLDAGAQITLVAPRVIPEAVQDGVTIRRRCFRDADLDGVWFVVAAATPATNARVSRSAKRRRIFINAVDDPVNASAYFGATIKRGNFVLAVSTTGAAPAMARLIREALETVLPDDIGEWLALAQTEREQWLRNRLPMSDRYPLLVAAVLARYGASLRVAT